MLNRTIAILLLLFALTSCLEPIEGVIGDYQNLLVVDAAITNESLSYRVELTRTVPNIDEPLEKVINAAVQVEDNEGYIATFDEISDGVYVSDVNSFLGEVGKEYRLLIKTRDGKEYESDWSEMQEPTPIDSVYFDAEAYVGTDGRNYSGVRIFVDGEGSEAQRSFLRWSYVEDWKFRIPYPQMLHFNPDSTVGTHVAQKVYCWKSDVSRNVVVHSFENQTNHKVLDKKLNFIRPMDSDRTSVRYRIIVKQHSITQKEYNFWNNLKLSTQDVGDLFGKQPFSLHSNITCITDPQEPVLGYFQVSGVSSEQLYLGYTDLSQKGISVKTNHYNCRLDTVLVDHVNYFDAYTAYQIEVLQKGRGLVNLMYAEPPSEEVVGLILSHPSCLDCTYAGNPNPPYGWVEEDN